MRKSLPVFVVLLVIAVASLGCSSSTNEASGFEEVVKVLPNSTIAPEVIYYDVKQFREDASLEEWFEKLKDRFKFEDYSGYEFLSVENNVDYLAAYYGSLLIIGGKFNLNHARVVLKKAGYEKSDYKGLEIWSNGYRSVAIVSDRLVMIGLDDRVKESIDVIKGEKISLADGNTCVQDVMSKLPENGLLYGLSIVVYDARANCGGYAVSKVNESTAKVDFVIEYSKEDYAKEFATDYEKRLKEGSDSYTGHVERDGKIVKLVLEGDLEDMLSGAVS